MNESPVEGPDATRLYVDPSVRYSLAGEFDADHG